MKSRTTLLLAALAAPLLHAGSLTLTPLSSVRNGDPGDLFDASAAEIVKFGPA